MSGTVLQWLTMAAFGALLLVCIYVGRNEQDRALAVALGLWVGNGVLFYIGLLVLNESISTPILVAWSALTRLQGILLGIVALVVLARRERGA